jgi:protein TonB
MRNFLLVIGCFICFANSYGQTATNTYGKVDVEITKESREKICVKVEIRSVFPGGDSSWVESIETKLNQSIQLRKGSKKGKYLVSVQFVVDEDGSISDVKALTSNGYGMEEEVLRAIKKKTKWLPSSQGVPVRPYRTSSSPPVNN